MIRLSRRYRFYASHRLHSPVLTEAENLDTFGKCNNPWGHGHNYEVELTVIGPVDGITGRVVDIAALDEIADEQILRPFRYRNLNEEIPAFRVAVPTTENLGIEIDRRLRASWAGKFGAGGPALETIRIWETERNICEVTDGK
jgi:6-pyruvoyltetrahydropterin/6-carboxytetrahydropterin synthase